MKKRGNRAKKGRRCGGQDVAANAVRRPKYLPNLRCLIMPMVFYESKERVAAARLFLEIHTHDADAAALFEGVTAPRFQVPRSLFPHRAPVDKIVFLPPPMLPAGFEAGGVFGPGVIPRRFYPTGLMPPGHKGQTPPLFVGLRRQEVYIPPVLKRLLFPEAQSDSPPAADSSRPPSPPQWPVEKAAPPRRRVSHSCVHELVNLELKLRREEFPTSNLIAPPQKPPQQQQSKHPRRHTVVQLNIYTPDLSNVLIIPGKGDFTVAVLSTVNHPHVPAVALAAMGDEPCPVFELSPQIFPTEPSKQPVFLPKRYLPKGFEACCVFRPGTLPDAWFYGSLRSDDSPLPQLSTGINPPVAVAKFTRGGVTTKLFKELHLVNEKPRSDDGTPEVDIKSMEFGQLQSVVRGPKGLILLITDGPETPRGAQSLQEDTDPDEMGCFLKIKRGARDFVVEKPSDDDETTDEESDQSQERVKRAKIETEETEQETETEGESVTETETESEEETETEIDSETEKITKKETEEETEEDTEEYTKEDTEEDTEEETEENPDLDTEEETEEDTEEETEENPELDTEEETVGTKQELVLETETETEAETEAETETENESETETETEPEIQMATKAEPDSETETETDEEPETKKQEAKKKYLKYFHVDSNFDQIAEAVANMGKVEMELMVKEDSLPGINLDRALDQMRMLFEDRMAIRAQSARTMVDHAQRIEEGRRQALRKERKPCGQCGKVH
ncbi:DM7 family protein GG19680 [Drosophila ficusphila]|uniref:DM7 family protein GG19680 n=1 Tax=Drosophila ficusphila TaxID=30025 RepID=UPI0007E5F9D4|nr:DM7 family protein GG19680 [Drosophila ficusphila]